MNANDIIDSFSKLTALVVGDVMIDSYLWGSVDRISPEAPVPVVRINERSARLGGAANVAKNVRTLGANAIMATVIGADANGDQLIELLNEQGIDAKGVVRCQHRKTTVKTRVISDHQHIVRVDEEETKPVDDEHSDALVLRVEELLPSCDVLILEDYDKGVLNTSTIQRIIALAAKAEVPVAVDPKRENFFSYVGVQLFKPNFVELRDGMKMDLSAGDKNGIREAVKELRDRLGNACTLVTLSEHGVFIDCDDRANFLPAYERIIADVSGAGDTVIATAALCLAQGVDPVGLATLSNLAGGIVCEHVGVVPIHKEELRKEALRVLTMK